MKKLIGLVALGLIGLASRAEAQVTVSVANAGSTGTTINKLAKLTGAPSTAVISGAGDAGGAVGVVISGAGTTGNALIARAGIASCVFDGATTAGHYVQISASVAGDCTDGGATFPTSGQVLGRVLSTNGGGGTYAMTVTGAEIQAASGASTGAANTWSAAQTFTQINETDSALTGCNGSTATMDLTVGTYFHCTVSAGGVTFAVSNPATSGLVSSFTLELTNPGSQTLTFMSGTKWPGGSQPSWTVSGIDLLVCSTRDAATTWRCVRSEADSK